MYKDKTPQGVYDKKKSLVIAKHQIKENESFEVLKTAQ